MIKYIVMVVATALVACAMRPGSDRTLAARIDQDTLMQRVKTMAKETVRSGFNAGDGYGEVWIRDYKTFIALATELHPPEAIKENLRVFFRLQGGDGDTVDGFIPKAHARASEGGYAYR